MGVKATRDVAQYHLHYVTYAPAKFEAATSNGLGDVFTRKYIIGPGSRSKEMLFSTLYNMWRMQLQNLKVLRWAFR